jgi:hypothetical protein
MWNVVKKDSIKNTIWGDIDEEQVKLDIPFLENEF